MLIFFKIFEHIKFHERQLPFITRRLKIARGFFLCRRSKKRSCGFQRVQRPGFGTETRMYVLKNSQFLEEVQLLFLSFQRLYLCFNSFLGLRFQIVLRYKTEHNVANKIIPNVLHLVGGECTYSRDWGARTWEEDCTNLKGS